MKGKERDYLAKVEVNEVLGLVRDVRAEVAADDAVPGWAENEV